MATLVGIFNMTHSPFCYMPPEQWNDVRASRSLRADVPVDDVAANRAKAARISLRLRHAPGPAGRGRARRARGLRRRPARGFDFTNFPTFAVYVGETFEGALVERKHREAVPATRRSAWPCSPA